ncbi:uncharacterized protein LOC142544194 [Primulina tabacum]|uniref:uncharacterized protein LOC142544194 n=1 Tax=Primulina tabacum TaxID=48773 RepID=UPI003F5A2A25
MDKVFSEQAEVEPSEMYFEVMSGMFLGYTVTERGIEANPEKGPDCEKALEELKNYQAELLVLAKPKTCERLWIYLYATEGAVSSVLIKQEGSTQQPVYYVSHALKRTEIRYSVLDNLALVMTVWCLRPYFLSNPIAVLTNSLLGSIVTHSDMSDRLENEDTWKVHVDGSSSNGGSGVGVLLILQAGDEVKLAIKLDFLASNNEVEYEAVLAGLWASKNVGAARVLIFWLTIDGAADERSVEARKLKIKCSLYVLIEEVLYRRSFAGPLLRCLSYQEADYVLREVYEECFGNHFGAYALAIKVLLAGYCWPLVLHDAQELVTYCESCQRHARLHHMPAELMRTIIAACPFDQ